MGGVQTQTINDNQTIVNNMLQLSEESCNIKCQNVFTGNNITIISNNIDFSLDQYCSLDNVSCIMGSSFDVEIQNILKSMLKQEATAVNGFSLNFNDINEDVNLNQLIENQISQIQQSSCNITAGQEISNNVFVLAPSDYSKKSNVKFSITQDSSISNSTCNMNNVSKAVSYNSATADVTQKSAIYTMGSMLLIAIIVLVVIGVIVFLVIRFSGSISSAVSSSKSSQKQVQMVPQGQYNPQGQPM